MSATVLVVNMQDATGSRPIRRARMIQEAELDYALFSEHFRVLSDDGDVDALLEFLTNCRIQARDLIGGFRVPGQRDPWSRIPTPWLPRRRHDLAGTDLFDAARVFIEWHLRALDRHVSRGTPEGIPNFVHIALSICEVAAERLSAIVNGVEMQSVPLTVDEWKAIRSKVDQLLPVFPTVIEKLLDDYVPALEEAQPHATTWAVIAPSIPTLLELVRPVLDVRDRIDSCRRTTLRVQPAPGALVVPRYFDADRLNDRAWRTFAESLRAWIGRLETGEDAKRRA